MGKGIFLGGILKFFFFILWLNIKKIIFNDRMYLSKQENVLFFLSGYYFFIYIFFFVKKKTLT